MGKLLVPDERTVIQRHIKVTECDLIQTLEMGEIILLGCRRKRTWRNTYLCGKEIDIDRNFGVALATDFDLMCQITFWNSKAFIHTSTTWTTGKYYRRLTYGVTRSSSTNLQHGNPLDFSQTLIRDQTWAPDTSGQITLMKFNFSPFEPDGANLLLNFQVMNSGVPRTENK